MKGLADDVAVRVRTNDAEEHPALRRGPDIWADFPATAPLEAARKQFLIRGRCWLGADEGIVLSRYRAGRVWGGVFDIAYGRHTGGGGEAVDSNTDPQARANAVLQAGLDRQKIIARTPGLTAVRAAMLDALCGYGFTLAEIARVRRRDRKSVQEGVLAGLDAVAAYPPWAARLDNAAVLALHLAPKRKPA